MQIDEGLDILSVIMWVAVGVVSICFCLGIITRNLTYEVQDDKTALTTAINNTPNKYKWNVRDYLLMLVVADEQCPNPKAVDIKIGSTGQDTLLKLDSDYVSNKEGLLQQYYIRYLSAIKDSDITSYDYYYSDSEVGRWRFNTY